MRSYADFVRDRSGGLASVRFGRFCLGGCALNVSITPYFAFKACFIRFLYILPWLHKNTFKRVLQRSIRISFGSGCVWYFRSCSRSAPGLSPAGCTVGALVLLEHAGRRGFIDSRWRFAPDRLEVSGMVPGRGENTKKMYDNSKTASKLGRFELGKSEKIAEI